MNKTGFNLRKMRELKGYSQDYMANELNISQASYARLENENTKITVERLYKIAEILEVAITDFFENSKITIQTQNNTGNTYGNGYIQNLSVECRHVFEKLIESKNEQIKLLTELLLQKESKSKE